MFALALDRLRDAWWGRDRKHHIREMLDKEAIEKEHREEEFKSLVTTAISKGGDAS